MHQLVKWPAAGKYLLAVSGGGDSMALLDLMAGASGERGYELVVAHFDHGLRPNSAADRHIGLEQPRAARLAAAVVTAHHLDDLIETSLLNLARGSGRRGLAPMQRGPLLRPLLGVTRDQLRDYAAAHNLRWHEDPTNA